MRTTRAQRPAVRQRAIADTRAVLPAAIDAKANILRTLSDATPAEREYGCSWYDNAHDVARTLDPANPTRAAGIIAALSPQTDWERNLDLAAAVLDGDDDVPHFDDALRKARAIRAGDDPTMVLGGRKVRSFFHNIADPTRSAHVTIDRHALEIAAPGTRAKVLERIGAYHFLTTAYRSVARTLNLRPHQAQAIAWTVHRRPKGYTNEDF